MSASTECRAHSLPVEPSIETNDNFTASRPFVAGGGTTTVADRPQCRHRTACFAGRKSGTPVLGASGLDARGCHRAAIGHRRAYGGAHYRSVAVFNVALGVFHEGRAGEALAALKSKLALKASVKRDGQWIDIPAAGLVPGDIVRLALGGVVPADARILDGSVLLDQSMLTGESVAVEISAEKTAYAGALVRRGAATAEITATGNRTYFGKTAELVRIAHAESGEQKAVLGVVRNLAVFNGAIVVVLVTYAHSIAMPVDHIIPLVLTALLASVPVALPATFTLAAALSAQALTKKGVLLTRLSAIHEAATVDVLCADKTGTLTRNELQVTAVKPMRADHRRMRFSRGPPLRARIPAKIRWTAPSAHRHLLKDPQFSNAKYCGSRPSIPRPRPQRH